MKRKYAVDANRLFLLSIIMSQFLMPLVIFLGVQDLLFLQFLIEFFMVLPCAFYLFWQRRPLRESIGINPLTWKQWLLLLPLAVCMDKIAEFVNVISQLFSTNIVSGHMTELILQYPLPVVLFVVAGMPMLCEELIYRGVLYQGYRRTSVFVAIVLSAFLFGIMHMNLNQFSYAVVLGVMFCLINEAAGSILPSMVMHFYINGRSVVLLYAVVNYLTGLHNEYLAAEAVGNTGLMAELLEKAGGVPIQEKEWLTAYLNTEPEDVTGGILASVPGTVLAVAGVILIVGYFLRSTGRTEYFKAIFRRKEKGSGAEEEKRNPVLSVLSPSLFVGCIICLLIMVSEFLV